jgi:hypothetical protein
VLYEITLLSEYIVNNLVRFYILTVARMNMTALWDLGSCSLVAESAYCLIRKGDIILKKFNVEVAIRSP